MTSKKPKKQQKSKLIGVRVRPKYKQDDKIQPLMPFASKTWNPKMKDGGMIFKRCGKCQLIIQQSIYYPTHPTEETKNHDTPS